MTARARAHAVLVTKDEDGDLLDDWVRAWTRAASGGLTIVDNGSTRPETVLALRRAARVASVRRDARPFGAAVHWMSEHIADVARQRPDCDFLLPLETDEFPADPEAFEAQLGRAPPDAGVVRYARVLASLPPSTGFASGTPRTLTRFVDQGWDKLAVRREAFVRMTQWCHHAQTAPGFREWTSPDLELLHFHATGFAAQLPRALAVVRSCGLMDTHASESHQLRQLEALGPDCPLQCAHKLEYLRVHLRRRAALRAYRARHGRLPRSPAALDGEEEGGEEAEAARTWEALTLWNGGAAQAAMLRGVGSDVHVRAALSDFLTASSSNRP